MLSCSEGIPTSVLTCMRVGLLQIVNDSGGASFPIATECNKINISYIKNTILKTIEVSESDIKNKV